MFGVMKDSRIGAFAAIDLVIYFLIQTACFAEIKSFETALICASGFVLSRAWSGLAAVTFKSAKGKGTLQSFSKPAHKKITVFSEVLYIIGTGFFMMNLNFKTGGCAFLGSLITFVYYRIFSYKKFGGTTGDIAGCFLQICELFTVLCAVIAGVIL